MAGSSRHEPPLHASIPRPSITSQHSSSVPSTPYQKPRDLGRFHSRSPSPARGIANQSPRSVASEQVGFQPATRATPLVCKYESGSEYRKRRIPYVDGGNEELGPPTKQPRKALQPAEQDKLSGDMRELYDRLLPSDESEERRARLVAKLDRMLNEKWPGNDIRVNVFGSSGNLLSSTDSDVDICITTTVKQLESMHSLAQLLANHGMEKVICRAAAKVPIVKCWDPDLKLAADLNVNNPLALQNTRMIKTYVQLDSRVRPLAKIIKYWTKRRLLNDAAYGGTISSYTWICMIINFLQRRNPPILPSLQKMTDCRTTNESPFADDLEALKKKGFGKANKESLGDLLFYFFRHYGYEFEFSKHVVSVREGRLVTRKEKGWDPSINYDNKESRNRLCVEEPFTANRNLGNSADDYAFNGIHREIRRAFDLLDDGLQLDKCCEQFEFPPEEKPIFQRPPPKPKPTLTRSHSQTNRSNHEQGPGRSRKANRNQSAQRAGNRRASSGAAYSNQRNGLPFSPPLGGNPGDYFQVKGNLHEQLFQQYQYLQAQQDALRHQLERQQQNQANAASTRVGDLAGAGSPRTRQYANGLSSPRYMDNVPQTAPLFPGYLYHYPSHPRYPPPTPITQTRSREGTTTNPSSPSLVAAVPALRRNGHRASVPEGLASTAVRSQSQPGRALPHPLSLQQHMHPGYDITGGLPPQYQQTRSTSQMYPGQASLQLPLSAQYPGFGGSGIASEAATPKEYVGYYVGQSPQLGPQQFAAASQIPPSPLTLRDPPTSRQRRVTPDLMPPILNGRHRSRSPSPLGQHRSVAVPEDALSAHPLILQSPQPIETQPVPLQRTNEDLGGPVIVNGSGRGLTAKMPERPNGVPGPGLHLQNEVPMMMQSEDYSRVRPLPIRTEFDVHHHEQLASSSRKHSAGDVSPMSKAAPEPQPGLTPNGLHLNGHHEMSPLNGPMLSPVAELRTPSPTRKGVFEHDSPEVNGLLRTTKVANAKQVASENGLPRPEVKPGHERRGSAPNPSATGKTVGPSKAASGVAQAPKTNEWQTASSSRHKHKKNKSNAGTKSNGSGGQPMPANESERKGG